MHRTRPPKNMGLPWGERSAFILAISCSLLLLGSCAGSVRTGVLPASLLPSMSTVEVGAEVSFRASGAAADSSCTWTSSSPALLTSIGNGRYKGQAPGTALAVLKCQDGTSTGASVVVTAAPPGPLVITKGGTYSGTWTSNDPAVPAVDIRTDEPVTVRNSVLTSRGDLIDINGVGKGAQVTIENTTGTALDPQQAGLQRGAFISAQAVATLKVEHCSMYGVSFGVRVLRSTLSALSLKANLARELEDRASDGHGGLTSQRPSLGHFIFLYNVSAPAGGEIAWNQVVDTIGTSSTEDVINLFKTQGSATAPINVHDNYMEGYSSASTPNYSGAGLITDGDADLPVTAYVTFEANQMVHTAGSGIEIAVGHDILADRNRVVSCGMDAQGKWFAMPFVNAVVLWNDYGAPHFNNIVVRGTRGGLLKPDAKSQPTSGDLWARASDLDATDSYTKNHFTDPCMLDGAVDLQAEDGERIRWATKLTAADIFPGAFTP